ncbi:MAG: M23 family metallopeptidase [Firmicutes bacterium]|nr:M23 family metallopeptidase [Bacillota bacterium]
MLPLKIIFPVLTKMKKNANLYFLLGSAFALWGILSFYSVWSGTFYAVAVNGLEAGLLKKQEELPAILEELQSKAADYYDLPVVLVEDVTLEKVFRPSAEADAQQVTSQLRHLLSYKVAAQMVTVNERDVFPVKTEKEVEKVIELVRDAYITCQENVSLEKVLIGEKISFRSCYVYPEKLYTAETLVSFLLQGTKRREVYLVSRGDSLWKIARDNNLSVDTLKEANPQLNGDALQEGDEISLVVAEPLVNVTTVERLHAEESIPFETEYTYDSNLWRTQSRVVKNGVLGQKEVVYQVTKENGVEIKREKLQENVLKEPEARVIAAGLSQIPSQGTGSFSWPVRGGGRISSGYGWRNGGFHAGVDIAAPTGTPVLAADSGVVVFQGWDGGYGLCVVVNHGQYCTRYAHNSRNLVNTGQAVSKGQVIASIGSTGQSTGSHLHFEIRSGGMHGSTVNPLNFFRP